MRRKHGKRSGSEDARSKEAIRSHRIGISVNDAEWSVLEARAKRANMSIARYCREQSLSREVREVDKSVAQVVIDQAMNLNKIGSNINQIAHQLNAAGVTDFSQLERLLAKVDKAMGVVVNAMKL